jgi:hypothetical protein
MWCEYRAVVANSNDECWSQNNRNTVSHAQFDTN